MFKQRSYKLKVISILLILTLLLTGCREPIETETYIDNPEVMESECVKESTNALDVYTCIINTAEKLGLINDSNPPMFLEFEPDVEKITKFKIFSPYSKLDSDRAEYGFNITEYTVTDGHISDVEYLKMGYSSIIYTDGDDVYCYRDNGYDFYESIERVYTESKITYIPQTQIPLRKNLELYLEGIKFDKYNTDTYFDIIFLGIKKGEVEYDMNINIEYMYSTCEDYNYPVDIEIRYPEIIEEN